MKNFGWVRIRPRYWIRRGTAITVYTFWSDGLAWEVNEPRLPDPGHYWRTLWGATAAYETWDRRHQGYDE